MKQPHWLTGYGSVLATFLLFLSAGCKPAPPPAQLPPLPPRTIVGQVFITKNDGSATKMAGITVSLLPLESAQEQVEAARAEAKRFNQELASELKALREERDAAERVLDESAAKLAPIRKLKSGLSVVEREFASSETMRLLRMGEALEEKSRSIREKIIELEWAATKKSKELHVPKVGHLTFQKNWGRIIASSKTDADGRFSFTITNRNRLAMIAVGARKLLDEVEEYHWVVPVDNSTETLLLDNSNRIND